MPEHYELIITCEHGGNEVPAQYARLFRGKNELLQSHRGYDFGALELAKRLSMRFGCSFFYSTVTRLLVDLNRSPDNPKRFAEFTRGLSQEEKRRIETLYYLPYRESAEEAVAELLSSGQRVLHVSVHSFAPKINGKNRHADIGLLYDPKRKREVRLCTLWQRALVSADGSLKVRRNYPYRGVSDGLTTYLRRKFSGNGYVGVEVEINQKYPRGKRLLWDGLMKAISDSLENVVSATA